MRGIKLRIRYRGEEYDGLERAAKAMNVHATTLNQAIKAGQHTCVDMDFEVLGQSRYVLNCDTGEVYRSAVEASKSAGVSSDLIRRACRGERRRAGKIRWKYIDRNDFEKECYEADKTEPLCAE